jgi:UDP-2,3-diacylglucosamine pyrophosphatase LpxH
MNTLILSDLHVGPDHATPIYAGRDALPAMIAAQPHPLRVVLNGDSFDVLLDDEPLALDSERAKGQISACLQSEDGKKLVAALCAVLANGGELLIRPGNHDLELAIPAVQDVVRAHFAALGAPTDKLTFSPDDQPTKLRVGDHDVLVTHGEHDDPFNKWFHADVLKPGFKYPAGSMLVKSILNPLKKQMRFLDLLKPDFQGAIMTALAIKPGAAKALITGDTLAIIKRAIGSAIGPQAFPITTDPAQHHANRVVGTAELTEEEAEALFGFLDDDAPVSFAAGDGGLFRRALDKLARGALKLYASAHKSIAGDSGTKFFSTEPSAAEWEEAARIAAKFGAQIVVSGHSHARRVKKEVGLVYVNTGTWITLLELPDENASTDEWADYLKTLRDDPMLENVPVRPHGSACLIRADVASAADAVELLIQR